jgi:hypothetical protein
LGAENVKKLETREAPCGAFEGYKDDVAEFDPKQKKKRSTYFRVILPELPHVIETSWTLFVCRTEKDLALRKAWWTRPIKSRLEYMALGTARPLLHSSANTWSFPKLDYVPY